MDVQSDTEDPMLDPNVNAWMDQGFHCGMTQVPYPDDMVALPNGIYIT